MKKSPAKKLIFCSVRKIPNNWVGKPIPQRCHRNGSTHQNPRKPHNTCGKKHDKTVDSLSHTAIAKITNTITKFSSKSKFFLFHTLIYDRKNFLRIKKEEVTLQQVASSFFDFPLLLSFAF